MKVSEEYLWNVKKVLFGDVWFCVVVKWFTMCCSCNDYSLVDLYYFMKKPQIIYLHNKYLCIIFQVNLEYLESKLECLDGEEVQQIQDNINSLFHHCVQAMGEEHQIKVVNALQVYFSSLVLIDGNF